MTKHINPQPFESKHIYYPGTRDSNFLSNVLNISEQSSPGQVKSIFSWGNLNYLCQYKDASLQCKNTDFYSTKIEQGQISLVVSKDTNQKIFVEITQAKQQPNNIPNVNQFKQVEASTFGITFLLLASLLVKKFDQLRR